MCDHGLGPVAEFVAGKRSELDLFQVAQRIEVAVVRFGDGSAVGRDATKLSASKVYPASPYRANATVAPKLLRFGVPAWH